MEKADAVAALGQGKLLRPARIKTALSANDRLKFMLSVVQAAESHARAPAAPLLDLRADYAAARMNAPFTLDLPAAAWLEEDLLHVPEFQRLAGLLQGDLRLMARPFEGDAAHAALIDRAEHWCQWLDTHQNGIFSAKDLTALTGGHRGGDDTFHILVMDLHKAINALAAALSDEEIDGAHVWQLADADRPRIAAFMRGLNRTKPLKFEHPGLDTAATRDGSRLLIQNDIGTNDAHVLVLTVEDKIITLTYSDLHERRFAFFKRMLERFGAVWSQTRTAATAGLNAGAAYYIGTARFEAADDRALDRDLEAIGAHIVFLIDWNRARKRLSLLVGKNTAIEVLDAAAEAGSGHIGWLRAGGERLVFAAMEALGSEHFRIGDRLDEVLGAAEAKAFLTELLALTSRRGREGGGTAEIADEARLLLARYVGRHQEAFAALSEHAAYCHALAEGLNKALLHGHTRDAEAAAKLAARAKTWERKADHLVIGLRDSAARNPRRRPFLHLIETADDAADALEEAAFLLSLIAEGHHKGWTDGVREVLGQLAGTVLAATQDHVRALAMAADLAPTSPAAEQDAFIGTCWRVVTAERVCDALMRDLRRLAIRHITDAASLTLVTDFAGAFESATDAFLRAAHGLRSLGLTRLATGAQEDFDDL